MHKYLKAIGFTDFRRRQDIGKILKETEQDFDCHQLVSYMENVDFCERKKSCGKRIGISVYGEMDIDEKFEYEYFTPYFEGTGVTSYADVMVERRIEKEMYVGICEDVKMGASIIFHLQNPISYMKERQMGGLYGKSVSVTLAGLGVSGRILLPISKDEYQMRTQREEERNRMMLLSAAREGDQEAIETLTLEDIDTYSKVSRRLITEDVFTIVETYFMPYGVECDEYSIMGEICSVETIQNEVTSEMLYLMKLNVNELSFDVCIPVNRVFGEPAVGRRFKGVIWLQGKINFEK